MMRNKIEKLENNVSYKYMSEYVADDSPSTREQLMEKVNEIIEAYNILQEDRITPSDAEAMRKWEKDIVSNYEDSAEEKDLEYMEMVVEERTAELEHILQGLERQVVIAESFLDVFKLLFWSAIVGSAIIGLLMVFTTII